MEFLFKHSKVLGWDGAGKWLNDSHVIAFEKGFLVEAPGADDPKSKQSFATYLWRFSEEEVQRVRAAGSKQDKQNILNELIKRTMNKPEAQQRRSFWKKMGAERKFHTNTWRERMEKLINKELSS